MKKSYKVLKICIIIMMAAALFTGGCFVMNRYYAAADFGSGTWINGIYCAGRSIEEVDARLTAESRVKEITIYDREQKPYTIETATFGERPGEKFADREQYTYSYAEDLKNISMLQKMGTGNILSDIFGQKRYEARAVSNAPVQLEALVAHLETELPLLAETMPREQCSVKLMKGQEGYVLINEKEHYLDVKKAAMAVYNAVLNADEEVYLTEEGCYENLPLTDKEQEVIEVWEKLNRFQTASVTYQFGEDTEVLDASVLSDFIALTASDETEDSAAKEKDKQNKKEKQNKKAASIVRNAAYEYTRQDFRWDKEDALMVDETAIVAYIEALAAKYDTYNGVRRFKSTRGDIITVEGGTYGNQLDQKAETAFLLEACIKQQPQTREPEYSHKALYQGEDDIGPTYIEIDMGQQMMYYYEDGKKMLETPVVTGNTGRRMGTPARVCYVYNKQKNRVLRGPGYASPVKFWMPVNGNIGIHDASWRKEFGGEIYKTNGSHGCINTPTEMMTQLYDMVEIGTPVIMFYE